MSYKKFNIHGQVGVLISFGYGKGWSSNVSVTNTKMRREMMMNKMLVEYVIKCRGEKKNPTPKEMKRIWDNVLPQFPAPDMNGVAQLNVMWVNKDEPFQIRDVNGAEYLYSPHDDPSWIIA